MNKTELASYLVSLHTLMEAQMKSPHSITSPVLTAEYERCWNKLKETIEDEARDRKEQDNRDQSGTDIEGDLTNRS